MHLSDVFCCQQQFIPDARIFLHQRVIKIKCEDYGETPVNSDWRHTRKQIDTDSFWKASGRWWNMSPNQSWNLAAHAPRRCGLVGSLHKLRWVHRSFVLLGWTWVWRIHVSELCGPLQALVQGLFTNFTGAQRHNSSFFIIIIFSSVNNSFNFQFCCQTLQNHQWFTGIWNYAASYLYIFVMNCLWHRSNNGKV